MKKALILVSFFILIIVGFAAAQFFKPTVTKNTNNTQKNVGSIVAVEDVTIITAGDIACGDGGWAEGECKHQETAKLVQSLNPDAVLIPGDLQYGGGTADLFNRFFGTSWGAFKDKIYPTVGNHEYENPEAEGYFTYFGERAGEKGKGYYSFDLGEWHIIAINSNCWAVKGCEEGTPQYVWLQEDLQKNTKKCTLAFWHHPLITAGKHKDYPEIKPIWKLLDENGVDVVFTAHDHLYERFMKMNAEGKADENGMRSFVVGTGGRNLYQITKQLPTLEVSDDSGYGVLQVNLQQDTYAWKFVPLAPSTFTDSGEDTCN